MSEMNQELYLLYKKEKNKEALDEREKETKSFKEWYERYQLRILFEAETGLKAFHKGTETQNFLKWIEVKTSSDYLKIKYVVKFFLDENDYHCKEIPVRNIQYNDKQQIVWQYNENYKQHILDKIGHTVLGVPYYYVIENLKNSVGFLLNDKNDDLIVYGCSSFDQYNKHHSAILEKSIKTHLGKIKGKWTIYFIIFLFTILFTAIWFYPAIFAKYFL